MRLPAEILAEMRRLVLVDGWRVGTVAARFGCHHSVVRRAIRSAVQPLSKPLPSKLDEHKPELRGHHRHRSREHWESEAARVGPETDAFIRETFDSDDVLSQLRTVIAVVSHLKKFPTKRAEATCRRARLYGSYSYQAIKNILEKALDLEALPVTLSEPNWDTPPTYARDISTLVIGGNNERH